MLVITVLKKFCVSKVFVYCLKKEDISQTCYSEKTVLILSCLLVIYRISQFISLEYYSEYQSEYLYAVHAFFFIHTMPVQLFMHTLILFQKNLAKVHLVHVVIGNESCDLDSSAAALTYSYYLSKKVRWYFLELHKSTLE